MGSALEQYNDNFKKKFKTCRFTKSSNVAGIQNEIDLLNGKIAALPHTLNNDSRTVLLGLQILQNWELQNFPDHKGLFLIRNPFTPEGQRYWIRKCLQDYPRKPNKKNIDAELDIGDWWLECFKNNVVDDKLLKKLRWTTFGYQHNWDTKVYSEESRSPFPEELAELCDVIASYMGYTDFKAEAAIVNYYHMGSTLSPHTDHSEMYLGAPLFSFSFGQSAVFLIGGKNKHIEPSAILLNSGDVLIMSEDSRLSYHAVPKIVHNNDSPWLDNESVNMTNNSVQGLKYINYPSYVNDIMNCDKSDWQLFHNYVSQSRINVNVRQVFERKLDK